MAAIELAKSRSIHLPMLRLCRQVIDGSLAPETAVNQLIALHVSRFFLKGLLIIYILGAESDLFLIALRCDFDHRQSD